MNDLVGKWGNWNTPLDMLRWFKDRTADSSSVVELGKAVLEATKDFGAYSATGQHYAAELEGNAAIIRVLRLDFIETSTSKCNTIYWMVVFATENVEGQIISCMKAPDDVVEQVNRVPTGSVH